MKVTFADDAVKIALDCLPLGLSVRLRRIPPPEQAAVLGEAEVPVSRMGEVMEEEDVRALDKAIRYKDSKVQLVRMMLMTRIKNDLDDTDMAEEMAASLLSRYPLDSVHGVYEESYKGKAFAAGSA